MTDGRDDLTGEAGAADGADSGPVHGGRRTPQLVHGRLRQAILDGEVEPGAPISQLRLSRELGISRGPLREALRMLEREGLIETEPNRRARVAGFSIVDLEQLYGMRIVLEALAISISTPLITDEELVGLERAVDTMEEAALREAYDDWRVPHRRFHAGLVAHCDRRLRTTIQELSDHAERYRHFYTVRTPKGWLNGVSEHRLILEAVQKHSPSLASARLARHYSSVVLGLLAVLAPEHDATTIRLAMRMAGSGGDELPGEPP